MNSSDPSNEESGVAERKQNRGILFGFDLLFCLCGSSSAVCMIDELVKLSLEQQELRWVGCALTV